MTGEERDDEFEHRRINLEPRDPNYRRSTTLTTAVTNARSIAPKIDSVIMNFECLQLDCLIVTETWLTKGPVKDNALDRLMGEAGVHAITGDRRGRGGGVAILFRSSTITLKEYHIRRKRHEIVAAKGTSPKIGGTIFILGVYVKPSLPAFKKEEIIDILIDSVNEIKIKEENAKVIIAGDFNRLSLIHI